MSDENVIRLSLFFGILTVMAIWERLTPRRKLTQGYLRWPGNFAIVGINTLLVRYLIPAGAIGAAVWADQNGWGVLNMTTLSTTLSTIIAVILLDLAIYLQHLLFHALPILWRLHMVHHADRDIDVSTGLRFHPIEILLSMLIKMGMVILIGAPAEAVLLFEVVLNGMAMFNHSNVRIPQPFDRLLRLLFVTPDMHRVHHSVIKRETNSNYGFNLSIWDRAFGTYRAQPRDGHAGMTIGLEQFQDRPAHNLNWMLRLPFTGDLGQYPIMKSGDDKGEAHE